VPVVVLVQFEIASYRKMLKVKMNTKNSIKHYLPLFSSKFASDFSTFRVTARMRVGEQKVEVRIDAPLRFILATLFATCGDEPITCEVAIAYEGG
jgi:hypothetical protein